MQASLHDRRFKKKRDPKTGERIRTAYQGNKPWSVRWAGTGKVKQPAANFTSKKEAQEFLDQLTGGLRTGSWQDPRNTGVTFAELADIWWRSTAKLAAHTRRGYHVKLTKHVLPYFGTMPQNTVTWLTVEEFIATKISQPHLGPKTVRDMVSIVSIIMRVAQRAGLRSDNPASRHSLKVRRRKVTHDELLDMKKTHVLVAHIRDPYKPLVWLLMMTGLRPAEVCGLRVRHIDFQRHLLHAKETWNFTHGYSDEPPSTYRGPAKTEAGDRSIPLDRDLCNSAAEMLSARAKKRGTPIDPDEPLFESIRGGKPLTVDSLRKYIIKPALEAAGLSTAIRTYDTRHSHATMLIDDGAQLAEVAERLGHEDELTTLRNYYHLTKDRQEELTARMTRLREEAEQAAPQEPTTNVIDLFSRKREA